MLILGVWIVGGMVAMLGAFVYAELAARRPEVGGQYAYLREAFHPAVGFLYGWVLLLVIQTGGMAAVTVTFARYLLELTGWQVSERVIVVVTIALLTIDQLHGRQAGQPHAERADAAEDRRHRGTDRRGTFPGAFAASAAASGAGSPAVFRSGDRGRSRDGSGALCLRRMADHELHRRRDQRSAQESVARAGDGRGRRHRALCRCELRLRANAWARKGLADTRVPATAVMRVAMGDSGAELIALGIAVSTLGFLSQSVLTAPRVYFAMARDGLFFRSVAKVTEHTHVPALAIVLQSVWTIVVALSGRYDQILNYVVSMDFLFFGLTGAEPVRVSPPGREVRRRGARISRARTSLTTAVFVLVSWLVVINTIYKYPGTVCSECSILLLGLPVYAFWAAKNKREKEKI